MTQKQSMGTAVVTGASSGIGAVYADRLARRGYDLVLVARNEQRLQALATRLRADTGRAVRVEKADLTDKSDLTRVEALLKDDASLSLLVNNAGFGSVRLMLASEVETMESMIDRNVMALTRLAFANGFKAFASRRPPCCVSFGTQQNHTRRGGAELRDAPVR